MKEYKVVTQKDGFWSQATDAAGLETGLNRLARDRWEVKSILHGEHLGWAGLRGGIAVVLEREVVKGSAPEPPSVSADYDAARVPAQRYYKDLGRITSALKEAGLVDDNAIAKAREEMATRGGHICDHLLALGAVTDERLRQFCRDFYELKC